MSEAISQSPVRLLLEHADLYVWGLCHQLGRLHRDLPTLKLAGVLCGDPAELERQGYSHNYGIAEDESLVSLALGPFRRLLELCPKPQALVFHNSYATSVTLPHAEPPSVQYFPAALLRQLEVDHIPYLGSFATGCTGLLSLILTASGICAFSKGAPLICLTADIKPQGSNYDARREKFLTSDCASGFLIGHEPRGYRVLGVSCYSTKRELMPLVEIIKRTVQMVRELVAALNIDCSQNEFLFHYPNIFPSAWPMVTNYLRISQEPQNLDGLSERAHCLSSDPIISLAARHRSRKGRLHVVVNFGSGLHLGIGIFKEEALGGPSA